MPRPTDSIKQKVYDSENAAKVKHVGKTYNTHRQVERRVFAILDRAYIKRNYPRINVSVETRRSDAAACCTHLWHGYALQFPTPQVVAEWNGKRIVERKAARSWAWCDWVILHEMAHAFNAERNGRHNVAGHGREFVLIFLDLVRHVMGREAHDIFKAELRSRNVPVTKARKRRQVTPEQRAELVDRMAQARAVRDANRERMQTEPVKYMGGDGRWAYGQTESGSWVVVGPDGKRRRAQSKRTAVQRVQAEARRESRANDTCRSCGRRIHSDGGRIYNYAREADRPTECGCRWNDDDTAAAMREYEAARRARLESPVG